MSWRVKLDEDIYKDETKSPFVTYASDGISTIRWHASDGSLWDMTLNSTGTVVTTAVSVSSSGPIPLWFTILPQ